MKRSPAQTFALAIGVLLVAVGAVGFLYCGSFGSPGGTGSELGIFEVNGWHNTLHLVTGLLGLASARAYGPARRYATAMAILYAAIAVAGFAVGNHATLLSIVPVNTEDSFFHALIAVAGCIAAVATPAAPPPSLAGSQPGPGFPFD